MTRKEKYPDTRSFHFFNANPFGRITGDCTIRAISTGLGISYDEVVMEMAELQCKTGYDASELTGRYLESKGWKKHRQPRLEDNRKYTGDRFCTYLSVNYPNAEIGNVIAHLGGHHIVCIKPTYSGDGWNCRYKVHDIWNSTNGCVGNYWTKEN